MVKRLEELLRNEISRIPKPYGIFLSGGIDSAILAALSEPEFAVTCNFPLGEKYDELEYAQIIARHLHIPLEVVRPQKRYFKTDLERAVKIIGQPVNSVSIAPWYNLMKYCARKTMINGEGADELFGGYSRYLILKQVFELYKRPELKNYRPTLDFLFPKIHSRLVEKRMPEEYNIEKVMAIEYNRTLPDVLLMERRLASHFNVDFRQPYMSPEIKRFAEDLPLEKKIDGWKTKVILKELAAKYLPEKIVKRNSKKGLVCPINVWMGWTGARGEFDKKKYMKLQHKIWNQVKTYSN